MKPTGLACVYALLYSSSWLGVRLDRRGWTSFLDRQPTIAISRQRGLASIANPLKALRFSTAQNGYRFNPVELETSVIWRVMNSWNWINPPNLIA